MQYANLLQLMTFANDTRWNSLLLLDYFSPFLFHSRYGKTFVWISLMGCQSKMENLLFWLLLIDYQNMHTLFPCLILIQPSELQEYFLIIFSSCMECQELLFVIEIQHLQVYFGLNYSK